MKGNREKCHLMQEIQIKSKQSLRKDLGVKFDYKLTFYQHVKNLY